MIRPGSGKALANEKKYPNIIELAVPDDGLDIELSRRIMEFHKSRHIQPRYGRWITKNNQTYCRWCFADLAAACDFLEQFGGAFYNPSIDEIRQWSAVSIVL
jgi:chitinase